MSRVDCMYSGGHFSHGFRRRLLMPLVGPLQELVLFVAILFTGCVDKLGVVFFAQHQVFVPKLAPPCLQCTCEPYPYACGLISVHGVSFLCESAMPWRGRSVPLRPPSGAGGYGNTSGTGDRALHCSRSPETDLPPFP